MVATTQRESGWVVAIVPCWVGLAAPAAPVALLGCGPTGGIGTDTDMIIGGDDDDDDATSGGPDDDDDATDTGPAENHCTLAGQPALSIGHGGGSFETFGDDAAVLIYGEQGGVHIDVALRAEHVDLSGAFISDIRGYLDDVQVATGSGGGGFSCDPETLYLLRDGIRLIFEIPPSQIDNQVFSVTAELTDSTGNVVMTEDAVWVVDPGEEPSEQVPAAPGSLADWTSWATTTSQQTSRARGVAPARGPPRPSARSARAWTRARAASARSTAGSRRTSPAPSASLPPSARRCTPPARAAGGCWWCSPSAAGSPRIAGPGWPRSSRSRPCCRRCR